MVVNGQSGDSMKQWSHQSSEWVKEQISECTYKGTFDLKKHVDSTKSPYQNVLNGQMPLSIRQTCWKHLTTRSISDIQIKNQNGSTMSRTGDGACQSWSCD